MNDDTRGLVPLGRMDGFEVAEGYTDIRGFEAYAPDGRRVGEVGELLVDPAARRVAAVTVDTDGHGEFARVPIEHVEIDTPSRRVLVAEGGVGYLGARRPDALDDATGGGAAAGAEVLRNERAEMHPTGDVRRVDGEDGMRADNPLSGGRDFDGNGIR